MTHTAQLMMTLQHTARSVMMTMTGELDIAVVSDVRDTIEELVVEYESLMSMSVDVTNVTFVDSTGLHILSQAHRAAIDRHLAFTVVAAPDSAVANLIRLCAGADWFGLAQPVFVASVATAPVAWFPAKPTWP